MNRDYECPNGCPDGTWTVHGTEPKVDTNSGIDPEIIAIDPDGDHAAGCRLTPEQQQTLGRIFTRDAWEA